MSIRADCASEVIGFEKDLFISTVINDPPTALKMMKLIIERLETQNKQLLQLAGTDPSDANFDAVADDTSWFSLTGDDGLPHLYNFNEATHFLGTLVTGDLDTALK